MHGNKVLKRSAKAGDVVVTNSSPLPRKVESVSAGVAKVRSMRYRGLVKFVPIEQTHVLSKRK